MPDAFIGVDIIVGMRGENAALFDESRRFVEELPEDHIDRRGNRRMGYGASFSDIRAPWARENTAPKKRVGKRVHHETFGDGVVLKEEGDRLEVFFDTSGLKKVIARFLTEV